jgi:hypothetical protein
VSAPKDNRILTISAFPNSAAMSSKLNPLESANACGSISVEFDVSGYSLWIPKKD